LNDGLEEKMGSQDESMRALANELSERYGEVIGGRTLWHALGYKTSSAFKQALARKSLSLPIFFMPGRKGHFALTRDVADWLVQCRSNAEKANHNEIPDAFKRD
jgi:hypothetical protein